MNNDFSKAMGLGIDTCPIEGFDTNKYQLAVLVEFIE